MNHKKITLDTERKSFESIIAMQGDNKSRYIDATIVNRSIPVDLTGCAVKFSAIKPDITDIFNDAVIIDAKGGKVQIELTNQTLAKEGVIQATLVILKEDMQLSVLPFFITVIENPYNPNAIESKPEYQALNNALIVADGYAKELQDASVNLEEKYTTRLNNFGSQLDKTVRKGEGGSVTWAMASQDFRENVTGGNTAVVGKDSVLKENIVDGEVIKSKASFYKKTRNLFDKEKAIYGKYVSSTTGELTTPSVEGTFYASDYVEVINGSKYNYRAKDNSYTLYAFYNNDKQFINGGNSNGTDIISPVDGFIRVSVWKNVDVDTVQFELGDATEYIEPYILEVEEEVANIKPKIEKVLENQVDYSDCNRNKFNPNIAIINKQVSPSNGSIIDVTAEGIFYASEMINVKGHEKINCIKNDFTTMYSTYAFYDVNGGFVSGGSGEINGIDIPSNATGFKFTVWKNILPENIMIELDGLNSFIRFDDDSRNQEVYLTKMKFKDIIINCIGDSITYGFLTSDTRMQSPYPSSLKSLLGAKEVRNYGLSGTTVANDRTVIGSFEPMSSPTRVETWDNNANVNIVLGGVNDFIKNVELGTIDDEVDTTFYGGYKSLIRQLYKKYPNKKIVIMTPLHYNLEYTPNSKGYILKDYVNAIREIAEMFGIYLIDLYAICDININTRGKYQIDGLHTNQFYVSNIMTPLIADGLNRAIQ